MKYGKLGPCLGQHKGNTARWGDTRSHNALMAWPEVALAYAAGGPSKSLPEWAPELFAAWDPAALHAAALQRIRWKYGADAADAAADLAARGTRADLDALALGLGWRAADSPERGITAAARVAAADLDRRARQRCARTIGALLAALVAVTLFGVLAGSGGVPALAAGGVHAAVGAVLGAFGLLLLRGHLNRRDRADGLRWGGILHDLTRPPSDAAETWHQLTARGPILDRIRAAWDNSRAMLAAPHTNTPTPANNAATWRHGPRCATPDGPTRAAVGEPDRFDLRRPPVN